MFLDPRSLFMLVVLVGVTGWVLKGLMVTWHLLHKGDSAGMDKLGGMEDRLRKLEAATTSIMVDLSNISEKQRFMSRLRAGVDARENVAKLDQRGEQREDMGISPMVTQSIPIIPRSRSPRQ